MRIRWVQRAFRPFDMCWYERIFGFKCFNKIGRCCNIVGTYDSWVEDRKRGIGIVNVTYESKASQNLEEENYCFS